MSYRPLAPGIRKENRAPRAVCYGRWLAGGEPGPPGPAIPRSEWTISMRRRRDRHAARPGIARTDPPLARYAACWRHAHPGSGRSAPTRHLTFAATAMLAAAGARSPSAPAAARRLLDGLLFDRLACRSATRRHGPAGTHGPHGRDRDAVRAFTRPEGGVSPVPLSRRAGRAIASSPDARSAAVLALPPHPTRSRPTPATRHQPLRVLVAGEAVFESTTGPPSRTFSVISPSSPRGRRRRTQGLRRARRAGRSGAAELRDNPAAGHPGGTC